MALYDTADLLARCKRQANRPASDELMTDTLWYEYLTEAQHKWVANIAAHCPEAMYSAPVKLTTADSGLTYSFGVDGDGAAIEPLAVELYETRDLAWRILPGTAWSPNDYILDATKIRFPYNTPRTFADGPYARFIARPYHINASNEPSLLPKDARILLVYDALCRYAERAGQDPSNWELALARHWMGDARITGDIGIMGRIKTAYVHQTAAARGGGRFRPVDY